jgi:hypothetical protein
MSMTVDETSIRRVIERCGVSCVSAVTAEALHRECFCLAVDPMAVREGLNDLLAASGTSARLADAHQNLFSSLPVFVPQETLTRMRDAVRALSAVAATPAYRSAVQAWAPPIATRDPGSPGGMLGFDFHLGPQGPRLIEINTNPGGLLLNAMLAEAQHLCLPDLSVPAVSIGVEDAAFAALLNEWRGQALPDTDALMVIVDDSPEEQYLYAEFVLYQRLIEKHGYRAAICDPGELVYADGQLRLGAERVGFVYNRLTDFALQASSLQPLRQAYLDRAVALSPHPHAHAIWADKRNLSLLCDGNFVATTGLSASEQALIAEVVPTTCIVTPDNRDELWERRRRLFFKPASGFGSRASYRGDKLTRKTWDAMVGTIYVAQDIVPPSERHSAPDAAPMKVDIRCYAYQGEALFFAARLYQGQTTNFRTEGGGFAPVLTLLPTG